MNVLIIKLSSLGDVVHTLPALSALREGFRKKGIKARIDWLVEEAASGILMGHPLLDEVIVVKRGWARNFSENLKSALRLRSRGYDMVLDFQGLLKSGVWVFFSGGRRRIGFANARELSHVFLNEKLPPYDPDRHAVDRYIDLARHAAGSWPEKVSFQLEGFKASGIERRLRSKGIDGPFFVLVTRARWASKLWDDGKFVELAKRIIRAKGMKAVLAGGPKEKAGLDTIAAKIGEGAVNMAGETDLKELVSLFRHSSFAVTVDSGPMHLAAAAGAKVVAIFGPTAPWRTGPYGKGHVVVRTGLQCSPCFKRDCKSPKCMEDVTVDMVMEAVEKVW